jgi:hypothetical protein
MRIVIGQVEVDLKNGGRISYDSQTDTLSIDPVQQVRRSENPVKKSGQPKPLMIEHDTANQAPQAALTKTALVQKIMNLVRSTGEPTASHWITMSCLGRGANPRYVQYLKLLLEEMVGEGQLVESIENNRRRYAIP